MTKFLDQAKQTRNPLVRKHLLDKHRAEKVRLQIVNCHACPLASTRTQAVPWRGPTAAQNVQVAFVGEGPGRNEDLQGKPFVGRSGALLDRAITQAGLDPAEVFICNVVCCRPPENRNPTSDEIGACRRNLDAQLDLAGTWLVVLLGSVPLQTILGEGEQIGRYQGKPFWKDGRVWYPTYHPAYAARNRTGRAILEADLRRVGDILRGFDTLPHIDAAEFTYGTADDLEAKLNEDGWAVVYSHRLEDLIVYATDELVKIPAEHHHLPKYTVDELVRVREVGRSQPLTVEDLRRIHMVKTVLNGKVVAG